MGLAVAAVVQRHHPPAPGRETTLWLAVESVVADGDTRLEERDRARFAAAFGSRPAAAQVRREGEARQLDAPWLWTRMAAGARSALGSAGVPLLQTALFALAGAAAFLTLAARLGSASAAWLVALTGLASAAFAVPFRHEPRAVEMAAVALAAAAVWARRVGPARPLDDLYRGEPASGAGRLRWLLAGAAAGVAVAGSPTYLPLVVPLAAGVPRGRRGGAWTLLALGLAATLIPLAVAGGPLWEPPAGAPSAALYGWAALGLVGGRGVGLLPYAVPLLLLVLSQGRDEGRGWAAPAALLSAVLLLLASPFDFVEGTLAPGNAWLLPPLALLLAAVGEADRRATLVGFAALGAPLLVAPWLAALGFTTLAGAVGERIAPLERLLPVASTLRTVPGAIELERPGLRILTASPGVELAPDGRLRLTGARAVLEVTSDRALSSLRFELGREAPAAIEVHGGRMGSTTFRPSGEMAIDVALDPRRARRHAVWWSRDAWIHRLELRLPAVPATPVPFDVPFGRAAVPREERP